MDHVALWVPALIAHVAVDLDKLLEDGARAAYALCREASRVVKVAVDVLVVLVVRVVWPKDGRADGAGKVLDVELLVAGGDVAAAQGLAALAADEVEPAEVVALAEGMLPAVGALDGEKLAAVNRERRSGTTLVY